MDDTDVRTPSLLKAQLKSEKDKLTISFVLSLVSV